VAIKPSVPVPTHGSPNGIFPRRRFLRYALFTALVVGLLTVPPAVDAALELRRARASFAAAAAAAKAFDVPAARAHMLSAGKLAASADRKLNLPQIRPARFIPVVGDNLKAVTALARGASLVGPAAEEALEASQAFTSDPGFGFTQGRIDTEPWIATAERLGGAAGAARTALREVRATGGLLLPPIAAARREFIKEAQNAERNLETATDAAALVPHFFGAGQPRTWLLAIQNPVESRATGGYLGAFGLLGAEGGKLALERFDNNNNFPALSTPAPTPKEFAENYDRFASRTLWVNTNMSPDFPTVAEVLSSMWEHATGRRIDGVIAIDAVGLNALLGLVGPVNAPPVGEINSDNFLRIALNEAYIRFPEKEQRSSFLLEVGREVWSRLLAGSFSNPAAFVEPMGEMVERKRLQIWTRDQQDRIRRLGLAGELRPKEGSDYLMVVSQNAAANKVDFYARRRISYQVDLTDRRVARGLVEVTVQNDAPSSGLPTYILGPNEVGPNHPPYTPGLNRTLTSVYRPRSSAIVGSAVDGKETGLESRSEKGLTVASHLLEIPSGRSGTVSLSTTGVPVRAGLYRLVVQHQPHLNPDQLELEITIPGNALVTQVSRGMKVEGNRVRWSGVLDTEKEFLVRYGVSRREL
jgi:hypothetical protein